MRNEEDHAMHGKKKHAPPAGGLDEGETPGAEAAASACTAGRLKKLRRSCFCCFDGGAAITGTPKTTRSHAQTQKPPSRQRDNCRPENKAGMQRARDQDGGGVGGCFLLPSPLFPVGCPSEFVLCDSERDQDAFARMQTLRQSGSEGRRNSKAKAKAGSGSEAPTIGQPGWQPTDRQSVAAVS